MSDAQNRRRGRRTSDAYTGLAFVFGLVGFVFFLTMDHKIMGLSFVVLGLSFYAVGAGTASRARSEKPGSEDSEPTAPGPKDD